MKTFNYTNYPLKLMVHQNASEPLRQKNSDNKTAKMKQIMLPSLPKKELPEILFITSYPPRECGIATYTQDLKNAIEEKFGQSFSLKIGALTTVEADLQYPDEVKYCIQTNEINHFVQLANIINTDKNIAVIFLQHEFGLFGGENGSNLLKLMAHLKKPIITTFHTVLPHPNVKLKKVVRKIVDYSNTVIVMTNSSSALLQSDYGIAKQKIDVVPHGTHLQACGAQGGDLGLKRGPVVSVRD